MNVLLVYPSRTAIGGIAAATRRQAQALAMRGHRVALLSGCDHDSFLGLRADGIEVAADAAWAAALPALARLPRLRRVVRAARPQVVVHQGSKLYAPLRLLVPAHRHSVVFHLDKLGGRRRYPHWIAVSAAMASSLRRQARERRLEPCIEVIPNALAPGAGATPAWRRHRSPRPLRIAALGLLVRDKAFDVLLEALARVRDAGIEFECTIGGAGPLETELRALRARLGLEGHVRLAGWIADPRALVAGCDLFCLPSRSESFGLAMAERR